MRKHITFIYKLGQLNIITLLVLVAFSSNLAVSALNPGDLKSIINSTTFYDPNGVACDNTTPTDNGNGSPVVDSGQNAGVAFNYFVGKGLTPIQSAGIVGNLIAESGVIPNRNQGGGTVNNPIPNVGFGIAQWTSPSRQQALVAFATAAGKPVADLGLQLDFVWDELSGGYRQVLGQLRGATAITTSRNVAADTGSVVIVQGNANPGLNGPFPGYERPANESNSMPKRVGAAQTVLQKYGGGVVDSTPITDAGAGCGGDGTGDGSGAVAGDAVQTAINYAWPDYHAPNYCREKPTYEAAIKKAAAAGQYIGGTCNIDGTAWVGVDCGAFVTRVMIDSGADPGYNFDGKGGNTIKQQEYLNAHPEKYQNLGSQSGTSSLQPGDIAINSQHTYMFVGKVNGFNGNSASASFSDRNTSWRAPMASNAYFSNSAGSFTWYRLIK